MFQNNASFDLTTTVIHLRDGGVAEPGRLPGFAEPGLWTVASFRAESDRAVHADVWERHPTGNEVLCVLSGAIDVHLRGDGEEPFARLSSGQACVVPAGRWHRLSVARPADLLAITPRTGTQHERATVAELAGQGAGPR